MCLNKLINIIAPNSSWRSTTTLCLCIISWHSSVVWVKSLSEFQNSTVSYCLSETGPLSERPFKTPNPVISSHYVARCWWFPVIMWPDVGDFQSLCGPMLVISSHYVARCWWFPVIMWPDVGDFQSLCGPMLVISSHYVARCWWFPVIMWPDVGDFQSLCGDFQSLCGPVLVISSVALQW